MAWPALRSNCCLKERRPDPAHFQKARQARQGLCKSTLPPAKLKTLSAPPCAPPALTAAAHRPQTATCTASKPKATLRAIRGLCYTLARPLPALSVAGNAASKTHGTTARRTCHKRNGKPCAATGARLRPPASAPRPSAKPRRETWPPGYSAAPSPPTPPTPTLRQRPSNPLATCANIGTPWRYPCATAPARFTACNSFHRTAASAF